MGFSFQDFFSSMGDYTPTPGDDTNANRGYPGSSTSNMAFDVMTQSDDSGNDLMLQQIAAAEKLKRDLANARAGRASALQAQQQALANAFGGFNDEYYADLEAAFRDAASTGLQSAYDDSVRGIYQGFKQRGLLTQGEVDAALSALDAQKSVEQNKIDKAAAAYSQLKKDDVAKKQKSLGDQLSGLAGGASTVAEIDKQTKAIQDFDFGSQLEKLKTPGKKDEMTFFEGFEKVGPGTQANVMPVNTAGPSDLGTALAQPSRFSTRGVQSPFSGSSIRVIG